MMKSISSHPASLFVLVAVLIFPGSAAIAAQHIISARAGIIQHVEGAASLDGQRLDLSKGGYLQMEDGQRLITSQGAAEVLLNPGTYLRIWAHGSMQMQKNDLLETRVAIEKGSVLVEVLGKIKGDPIRVGVSSGMIEIRDAGLYRIEAELREVRVYNGKLVAAIGNKRAKATKGKMIRMTADPVLAGFDPDSADPFHKWAAQRSFILFIATAETRRQGHWFPVSLGWLYNSSFRTRFYSDLIARDAAATHRTVSEQEVQEYNRTKIEPEAITPTPE